MQNKKLFHYKWMKKQNLKMRLAKEKHDELEEPIGLNLLVEKEDE